MRFASASLLLLLTWASVPRTATAQETEEAELDLRRAPPADPGPAANEDDGLRWPRGVRRVHWAEAVAAPVAMGTAFTLYLAPPSPPTDGRSLSAFDRKLQERLSLRDHETANRAIGKIGDIAYLGTLAYRGFDDLFMAGLIRGGWDVAWQLLVIDVLAFGIVGTVTWGAQALFGRQRPAYTFCEEDPPPGSSCDGGDRENRSLISGYLAIATAGAALTCLHHGRMRIYGNQRRGKTACVSHAVMAAMVGVARATGDDHWPTDMLMGTSLGLIAGWIVPRLIHYGFDEYGFGHGQWADEDAEPTGRASRLRLAVIPDVGARRVGLGAMGVW
jgi:membrane-associated phospholipid phosphatase